MNMLYKSGKIIPFVQKCKSWSGVICYAISDGCGGWYDPKSDSWSPSVYTFSNEDRASKVLKEAVKERK